MQTPKPIRFYCHVPNENPTANRRKHSPNNLLSCIVLSPLVGPPGSRVGRGGMVGFCAVGADGGPCAEGDGVPRANDSFHDSYRVDWHVVALGARQVVMLSGVVG